MMGVYPNKRRNQSAKRIYNWHSHISTTSGNAKPLLDDSRVDQSGIPVAISKAKAYLAQLYINSDQQSETISGTTVPMMVAYPHSRVSATAVYPH